MPRHRVRNVGDPMFDPDGVPFYHKFCRSLTEDEKEEIKSAGIDLSRSDFTHKEDDQIRENWTRFALDHKLSRDDSLKYLGVNSAFDSAPDRRACRKLAYENGLLTHLCRKLPNRSGNMVRNRAVRILDPTYVFNTEYEPFTPEDDRRLLKLQSIHGNDWMFIGRKMSRNNVLCCKRFLRLQALDCEKPDKTVARKSRRKKQYFGQSESEPQNSNEQPKNGQDQNESELRHDQDSTKSADSQDTAELGKQDNTTTDADNSILSPKHKKKKKKRKRGLEGEATNGEQNEPDSSRRSSADNDISDGNKKKKKKRKHKASLSEDSDVIVDDMSARKRKKHKKEKKERLSDEFAASAPPVSSFDLRTMEP